MSAPKHLVPHYIVEQFVQGHFHGRFLATTLFIDIAGFTDTTNQFMQQGQEGSEAMATVMQTIFEPLVQAVYAYGGFITSFAGDAFLAVFLDEALFHQLRQASSPLAGLAAARAMQRWLVAHPHHITPFGTFTFTARIGMGHGVVEWGIVGEPDFDNTSRLGEFLHAFYFRGAAVDSSTLAEQLALPNEIVISRAVQLYLGQRLVVTPINQEFFRLTAVKSRLALPAAIYLPPADLDIMANFLPEIILNQKVMGEYRQVATLFLNLRNVDTHEQLAPFVQAVFDLQQVYGGYLNAIEFVDKGCNLLLFWGMPISHENDTQRALHFVLELIQHTQVTFRAGLTYRLMYAGFVGAPGIRQEYSCYGRGVNLASRMMMAAPWGHIWMDDRVAQRAEQNFHVVPLGLVEFKGFAEPQPVFQLTGGHPGNAWHFSGKMVGRQHELTHLHEIIRPLTHGRFAGTIIVQGEPGIGKSRLLHAWKESLSQTMPTYLWLTAQTDEILRHSLNPFRYLLQHYFEQTAVGGAAPRGAAPHTTHQNRDRFDHIFNDLLAHTTDTRLHAELTRTRSFLGALLDLHWPDSLYEQLSGRVRFDNILLALQTFFQAESRHQPLILHIEDAHWLDADSWRCLHELTRALADFPVTLCLTSRDDLAQPAAKLSAPLHRLTLPPLDNDTLADLATDLLGHSPSNRLLRVLSARCDGNPFFAEQILYYLRAQDENTYEADYTASLLPLDVRAILTARLDKLDTPVKEVVQRAAILGREFDLPILTHMVADHTSLANVVYEAEQAAVWTPIDPHRYLFKHALLRDAAYDMQLQARRRHLHHAALEAMEKVYTDDLPTHYAELAYHAGQAQNAERELHYVILAGKLAAQTFAAEEAVSYFSRALELTPLQEARSRFDLLLRREAVRHIQGQRPLQQTDLEELTTLAQKLADPVCQAEALLRQARYAVEVSDFPTASLAAAKAVSLPHATASQQAAAYLEWGRALWRQGDDQAARDQLNQALDRANQAGLQLIAADSLRTLGALAAEQGLYPQAQSYYTQALTLYHRAEQPDRLGESATLNNLGVVSGRLGDYVQARHYYEAALRLRREIGDRRGVGQSLNNLGVVSGYLGDYVRSREYYEQSLEIRRAIGDRRGEGIALGNIAAIYLRQGAYRQAQSYYEQSLTVCRQIGDRWGEVWIQANLALLTYQQGDIDRALAYSQRALHQTQEIGDRSTEGDVLTTMGHIFMTLGRYTEATAVYRQAHLLRRDLGEHNRAMEPLAGLAHIHLLQGESDQAMAYTEQVLQHLAAESLAGVEELFRVYVHCYRVLTAVADPRATSLLHTAYDQLQTQAAQISDPDLRQAFLQVAAHQEINDNMRRRSNG